MPASQLQSDKLEPSANDVPDRFELGTPGLANMAGITAAVDHLADLVAGEGNRRQRLDRSFAALTALEDISVPAAISRLTGIPGVRMVGAPTWRTGTICFTVDSHAPYTAESDLERLVTAMTSIASEPVDNRG